MTLVSECRYKHQTQRKTKYFRIRIPFYGCTGIFFQRGQSRHTDPKYWRKCSLILNWRNYLEKKNKRACRIWIRKFVSPNSGICMDGLYNLVGMFFARTRVRTTRKVKLSMDISNNMFFYSIFKNNILINYYNLTFNPNLDTGGSDIRICWKFKRNLSAESDSTSRIWLHQRTIVSTVKYIENQHIIIKLCYFYKKKIV